MDLNDVVCFMDCWIHVSSNLQKNKCFFKSNWISVKLLRKKRQLGTSPFNHTFMGININHHHHNKNSSHLINFTMHQTWC